MSFPDPFDFVKSVTYTKEDLLEDNPSNIGGYVPFIVNKALSYHADTIMYAAEMNRYHTLDNDKQYKFYINTLRKSKRFAKWVKKTSSDDLEAVQNYYGYSRQKAQQALLLLTEEQLAQIRQALDTGGSDDRKKQRK
jgi:hypothetical protein